MFKTRLIQLGHRHNSKAFTPEEREGLVDGVSQKRQQIRIIYNTPCDFQVGHPSDSLAFMEHDAFQVYEAIFIATRDYTSARIQDIFEAPSHVARAYSAIYLICMLLSAAQRDDWSAPTLRRKPIKHARVLRELTHLLPGMFTQVVLLANGSEKLAKTSMASLQYADAVARKIPGWPPRHPVRRIMSNLVVLGHSEDPKIVSQVAKNARRCVLETCSSKGFRSTACANQRPQRHSIESVKTNQKVLPPSSPEEVHRVDTGKSGRIGNSHENPTLQQSWLPESEQAKVNSCSEAEDNLPCNDRLQHTIQQLNKGLDQKSSSGHEHKAQRAQNLEKNQSNMASSLMKPVATSVVFEQGSLNNSGIATLPARRGGDGFLNQQGDGPVESSAGNAILISRETDYNMGILDRCRLFIEQIFGEELDWRPLPPIKHPLGPYQSRMSWTVSTSIQNHWKLQRGRGARLISEKYNGIAMSILLNKDEALRHCGGRIDYHGNSNILPVCQPAPLTGTPTSTSAGGIENPKSSAWKQILLRSWTTTDGGSTGPASSDPGDKGATQQMESHLCVDKCWSSTHDTRMITVESVEHMKSDYDYFCQARHILSQAEGGWLQRKLSWRSYTRVNLSRVRVIKFSRRIKTSKSPSY